ncbi:MAG: nuclear transport factor 2 family protein [Solirubrobacteraceae bacterium]|nr:nuclear transport factor 2 family protein [Solirubrobacteraceae bacterium]
MHPFRAAVEAGDHDAIKAMLADDVTFLSPVAFAPYEGRELVAAILRGAFRVLGGLRYVRELEGSGGVDHALMFKATVDGKDVHGCDFLHLNEAGEIAEFCVMVRPLSGANAVATEMGKQFELIKRELGLPG